MNINELKELLKHMLESSIYSDQRISKYQYDYYMDRILKCKNEEQKKEVIKEIVYELDIKKDTVARKIAYPFKFDSSVMKWVKECVIKDNKYYCVKCKKWHPYTNNNAKLIMTLDHEPSLSKRFNEGEWKLNKEERKGSFNDIKRLQPMCMSENAKKGGEAYNEKFINEVFIREL
jgi:hypothetical protein